jgi:hypothetical protein
MATSMAMGQGAGTAAALAAAAGATTREVDTAVLRKKLVSQGQYLLGEQIDPTINEKLILKRSSGSGEKAAHYNPFDKGKKQ